MKKLTPVLLLLLFTQIGLAQKAPINPFASIDARALQIPDSLTATTTDISRYILANFKTDQEKTRAIFIWVASTIQYDIENMFAINFYESRQEKIQKALKTKKGICEHYAALFHDICSKSNIKSFVVEGYTKQNGFTDYIPHAWTAALVDNSWFLFDPTWGSGYINGGRFYKKINNDYYKVAPAKIIKSHMPFDYLWQFLNYPVTNQEFYEGKTTQNQSKPFFNYSDSIKVYEEQDTINRIISSAYRVERNGVKNAMIFDRLRHLKLEIENDAQNRTVNLYNAAAADYNEGINSFNQFIQYRNKQFTPLKPDADIQQMIDTVTTSFEAAKNKLKEIRDPNANISAMISQLSKTIGEASVHVKEQQDWLTQYLSKSKSKRKAMFYEKKVTVFGVPVN